MLDEVPQGPQPAAADGRAGWGVQDYDAARYGPILGVSDDGRAATDVAAALLGSPKGRVLDETGDLSIATLGACFDVERMGPAGELPVGPDEWAPARQVGPHVALTTNVGTVVLPRFYRPLPAVSVPVPGGVVTDEVRAGARRDLATAFAPFLEAPDGPRPITVCIAFPGTRDRSVPTAAKIEVLRDLAAHLPEGASPPAHRIALLQRASGRGGEAIGYAIDVAATAGLTDVVIEGDARFEAQDELFLPGLLAFVPPDVAGAALRRAAEADPPIRLRAKNQVDPDTASRVIWSGLTAARSQGAHLGKFGLFPLSIAQQRKAMETVRPWTDGWSATPAFYVDRPVVDDTGDHDRVVPEHELVPLAIDWLHHAAGCGYRVVLFDSPDRVPAPARPGLEWNADRGRRLIKRGADDAVGVLDLADVPALLGAEPGVGILWAGGLDGRQAHALARQRAFGIFTTSTTARMVAVGTRTDDETAIAAMAPTYLGVLSMKMAIEAGFLQSVQPAAADAIGALVEPVLAGIAARRYSEDQSRDEPPELEALRAALEPAWRTHLASSPGGPR